MAHETPGDPLARGLPSHVCTTWAGRQSRREEIVTECGESPVQELFGANLGVTVPHRLSVVFPILTRDVCCPTRLAVRALFAPGLTADPARRAEDLPDPQTKAARTLKRIGPR
jgi:hypothetical protein